MIYEASPELQARVHLEAARAAGLGYRSNVNPYRIGDPFRSDWINAWVDARWGSCQSQIHQLVTDINATTQHVRELCTHA